MSVHQIWPYNFEHPKPPGGVSEPAGSSWRHKVHGNGRPPVSLTLGTIFGKGHHMHLAAERA
jgi:hypothetical protein